MTSELVDLPDLLAAMGVGDDDTAAAVLGEIAPDNLRRLAAVARDLADLVEAVTADRPASTTPGWRDGVTLLCGCPPWVEEVDPTHQPTWPCAASRGEEER